MKFDISGKIEDMNCSEIYSTILSRFTTALMVHDELSTLFSFLSLEGFKKLNEHQLLSEMIERNKVKEHYVSTTNTLPPLEHTHKIILVPKDWYKYGRFDVTPSVRKQYTCWGLKEYREWEQDTKEHYEKAVKILWEKGYPNDSLFMSEIVKDVSNELKFLESIMLELEASDYDEVHLVDVQHRLIEKFSDIGDTD